MVDKVRELLDDELKNVNGGTWYWRNKNDVHFKWNIGDHIEMITYDGIFHTFTKACYVLDRHACEREPGNGIQCI